MYDKILTLNALPSHALVLGFDTGEFKKYTLDGDFCSLFDTEELYQNARIALGGSGVIWNDKIYIAADLLYEQGESCLPPAQFKVKKQKSASFQQLTLEFADHYVKIDDFEVLQSANGEYITDLLLLDILRETRAAIMKETHRPAYFITGNKSLVAMATEKPKTKDEFIKLYGLTEKTYKSYGERFIQAIIIYGK